MKIEDMSEEQLFEGSIRYCVKQAVDRATMIPATKERLRNEGLISD